MQTAFDIYSADQMFGHAAESAQDLQEVLEILRNSTNEPELRVKALGLALEMAQRIETHCTDAQLTYSGQLRGGVTGLLRELRNRDD